VSGVPESMGEDVSGGASGTEESITTTLVSELASMVTRRRDSPQPANTSKHDEMTQMIPQRTMAPFSSVLAHR
jgi:hypothetical protein